MSTETITEDTNLSLQELREKALPVPGGRVHLLGGVIRHRETYELHSWNGSLARFTTSEVARQYTLAYMRDNDLSEDDYSVSTESYTFVGSSTGEKNPDPWDAVKARCSCVPGTIKVVSALMSEFVAFIEDQGKMVKNVDNLESIVEIIDGIEFIDTDEILSNLQTALDALSEANDALGEAEMYNESSEVDHAVNTIKNVVDNLQAG